MRALAEFVMKGRAQAVLVSALGAGSGYFAWVSAAVIALVCLRRGAAEGVWLLGWSLLPALALLMWRGNVEPMATLVAAAAAALVLRNTVSWPLALLMATGGGFVLAGLLATFGAQSLAVQQAQDMLQQLYAGLQQAGGPEPPVLGATHVAALFGLANALTVALCLILARWWQALLYNPGGFRDEFHRLRLPAWMTTLLIGAGVLLAVAGPDWRLWSLMVSLPLLVAGFALLHGLVAARGLGTVWLVACYLLLLVAGWRALMLLLLLAVVDSWYDLRGRATKRPPPH